MTDPRRWPRLWRRIRSPWGRTTVFWRTFLAQVALIALGLLVWVQSVVSLELEPQALHTARQIASLVNLTRAALQHADPIARISLVKTLADEERLRIAVRERTDTFVGYGQTPFQRRLTLALQERLGTDTIVAAEVNGFAGLWVGFRMEQDSYWLLIDPVRAEGIGGRTWLLWLAAAVSLSVAGAAWVAYTVSRPLKALSVATRQVAAGQWDAIHLHSDHSAHEIREVNQGFQRMVRQLQALETDRRLMLAGISHDLRTPLARLRLEAELSVPDEQARHDMVADMAQIESILQQFMDYARPEAAAPERRVSVHLNDLLAEWQTHWPGRLPLKLEWPRHWPDVAVHVQPVELGRVVQNLLENACKYGRETGQKEARVEVAVQFDGEQLRVTWSDHGPGVAPDQLPRLTQPFYRVDTARSQAAGAGLGLAVARKLMQRMGGDLTVGLAASVGLCVTLSLEPASGPTGVSDLTDGPPVG